MYLFHWNRSKYFPGPNDLPPQEVLSEQGVCCIPYVHTTTIHFIILHITLTIAYHQCTSSPSPSLSFWLSQSFTPSLSFHSALLLQCSKSFIYSHTTHSQRRNSHFTLGISVHGHLHNTIQLLGVPAPRQSLRGHRGHHSNLSQSYLKSHRITITWTLTVLTGVWMAVLYFESIFVSVIRGHMYLLDSPRPPPPPPVPGYLGGVLIAWYCCVLV